MSNDFARRWAHLKAYLVRVFGEAVTLNRLRAATQYRLECCDPETLTVSYLHFQIIGDLYREISGQEIQAEPPRWSRAPYEQKIEKEILLSLVADRSLGLDVLEREIETNAQEYIMGTRNAVVAPVTSPPLVHQAVSSQTVNQPASAFSPALAQSQPPPPQRGLADSRWASQTAVRTNSGPPQSQAPKTETRNPASVTAQYPALPSSQPPPPTPGQPRLANVSQAQAAPVVTTQSLQQNMQREIEEKVKLLDTNVTAPQSVGGAPWEILLPPSVDALGSIKPYQRVLQDMLGVELVINSDRLKIGPSVFQLPGRPLRVRAAVTTKNRMSAYADLAAYVKHSRDTGVAPDIVKFLLGRQVDIVGKLRKEAVELGASRQTILGSRVAAPVAPHGEFLRYSAEKPKPREGQAPNPGNKNSGEDSASRKNNPSAEKAKTREGQAPSPGNKNSGEDSASPVLPNRSQQPPPTPPRPTTALPEPMAKETQGETKRIKKEEEERKQELQRRIQHRSTEVWQAAVKPLNFDAKEVFGEENIGQWKRAVHEIVTETMEERLNWDKLPGRLETAILQRFTFDRVIGPKYTRALELTRNIGHMVAPPKDSVVYAKFSRSMSELLKRLRADHDTRERAAELEAESQQLPEESETVVVEGPPSKPQVEAVVGGVARVRYVDTLTLRPKQPAGGAVEGADNETGGSSAVKGAGNEAAKEEGKDVVEEREGEEDSGSGEGAASKGKGKGSAVQPKSKEVPSRAKSQKQEMGELTIGAVKYALRLQARAFFGPTESGHEKKHAYAPTFPMPIPTGTRERMGSFLGVHRGYAHGRGKAWDRSPGVVELTSTVPLDSRPHRPPRTANLPADLRERLNGSSPCRNAKRGLIQESS
ncbi:hypothetical protein DL770_008411 [Monosporascus sp. CRB-9-2]|nr:hypothetical protein DL770_008411 [Monosporascus sp. CRB-9-2]